MAAHGVVGGLGAGLAEDVGLEPFDQHGQHVADRLGTFAVAPDPALAARALASSPAPELPTVLRAWLEAMLPTDGAPAQLGEDPQTSSGARLTACVSSLAPYPHLYRAVRPLLARISDAPPPPASS